MNKNFLHYIFIYMVDLPVFENFVLTQCGLSVNYAGAETVGFVNGFTALLATYDAETDDFIKITHTMNSFRPVNGKVLIPASEIVSLKDLLFELEDMARCGALPAGATLQVLDALQLNYMHVQQEQSFSDKLNLLL